MRLHLIPEGHQHIEGYEPVYIQYNTINLAHVVDNECEEILAPEILDFFDIQNVGPVIDGLLTKLRLGGRLVIGGTHLVLFCKSVVNSTLDKIAANNIVANCRSMTLSGDVEQLLISKKLQINSVIMNGTQYEISATRT